MHIAHLGNRYESETLHGPARAFSAYAPYLREMGHQLTIVQFPPGSRINRIDIDNSFHNVILADRNSALRLTPASGRFFRENHLGADLYHVHSSYAARCLAAHLLPVPYVVSTHGAYTPSDMQRRRLRNLVFRRLVGRRYLREAAAVHAITPFEREANLRYGGNDIHIETIPNAIQLDVAFNAEGREAMRSRLGVQPDDLVLLFLGRLDIHGKGLDTLVEGFRQARRRSKQSLRLLLVGEPWLRGVGSLIDSELADHVTVLPPVLGDEKRALLSAADAFATLSRWDVMPTAVLDALGTGLPVLVTEATGFGDFVRQTGNGAVVSSSEEVADAILTLDLPALTSQRSDRIDAALAAFHPRHIAEEFVRVYEAALGSPATRRLETAATS